MVETSKFLTPNIRINSDPELIVTFVEVAKLNERLNVNKSLSETWEAVKKYHRLNYNVILLTKNSEIVYHFFYTKPTVKNIFFKSFQKKLDKEETYLSAERTYPGYQGQGISQYAKTILFKHLNSIGIKKAHIAVDSKKGIPNHIYQKLGLTIAHRLLFCKLLQSFQFYLKL
jgi:hypothetical protein